MNSTKSPNTSLESIQTLPENAPIQSAVIGGASGIGEGIARKLAEIGHRVIIGDKNWERGRQIASELPNAFFVPVDVLEPTSLEFFVEQMRNQGKGYLTHVISTAGRATPPEVAAEKNPGKNPLYALTDQEVLASIHLNLWGTINVVKYLGPLLNNAPQDNRSVCLTSSINPRGFGLPVYSATKAGIEGLVMSMATPYGRDGIRINAIVPGSTRTPLTEAEGMNFEEVKKTNPLGRYNLPEDMAEVVRMLVTCKAMTGKCIIVDSGQIDYRGSDRYAPPAKQNDGQSLRL